MKIDLALVESLNLAGKGGQERLLLSLLPNAQRVSAPLYDYIQDEECIEVKKQTDTQWFDAGKYSELSPSERKITLLFVFHEKGSVTRIASISLGRFLDILLTNPQYADNGWTKKCLKTLWELKQKHPHIQAKCLVRMSDFVKSHESDFQFYY